MPRKPRHLTISEKRDFFTAIARDTSGEFTTADKFKAIVEDTKLFQLELELEESKLKRAEEAEAVRKQSQINFPDHLLQFLPPPIEERDFSPPPCNGVHSAPLRR